MGLLQAIAAAQDATRTPQGRTTLPAPLGSQVPPQARMMNREELPARDIGGTIRPEEILLGEVPLSPGDMPGLMAAARKIIGTSNRPIASAVISTDKGIFTGRNHMEAIDKARDAGVIGEGEGGWDLIDRFGGGWNDLFLTRDGKVIDRFEALDLANSAAAEKLIPQK